MLQASRFRLSQEHRAVPLLGRLSEWLWAVFLHVVG